MIGIKQALLGICAVTAGCGLVPCGADAIYISAAPGDTTVRVGAAFTARAAVATCRTHPVKDVFAWSSDDSTVVTIDEVSGAALAVGVGSARLIATDSSNFRIQTGVVTVIPR